MNDTVVIGGIRAWPEYLKYGAYVCQSGRSFRKVERIAYYVAGEILTLVPKLLEEPQEVIFERNRYSGRMGELVHAMLDDGLKAEGLAQKVFLLSPAESADTVKLEGVISNDLVNVTGKGMAFTRFQRYLEVADLVRVSKAPPGERLASKLK